MRSNPAQRLHDLLAALKTRPANGSTVSGWAKVLDVDSDDLPLFFEAISGVTALPMQIEAQLEHVPDLDPALFVAPWKDRVDAALAGFYHMGNPLDGVLRQYDDSVLLSLRHASFALRQAGRELDLEQVPALYVSLNELEELIVTSEGLDPDLVEFLLGHVHDMKQAVQLLRVRGPEGLQASLERTVGGTLLRKAESKPVPDPSSPVAQKLQEVVLTLGAVVTLSNESIALTGSVIEGVQKALGA